MNVRLSPEEKILFQKAATLASLSLSEWVRKVLIAAAQPAKPSEPGEGVLRMEKGKYFPIVPPGVTKQPSEMDYVVRGLIPPESALPIEPEHFNNPLPPQLPVTAGTTPIPAGGVEPLPEPVVTPAPARPMSMVDRMYAIIEARDGKEKADFWLLTNAKRK